MKKLIFCGAAAAIIAGCSSTEKQITVFDTKCDQVAKFDAGTMVVKCPMSRIMTAIQQQKPNNKFVNIDGLPLAEFAADTEHAYVEIIPNTTFGSKENQTQYRVMVPNADITSDRWAVALISD